YGCLSFTDGGEVQCELAVGRVELAFSVAVHVERSGGRVSLAAIVKNKCAYTICRVVGAGGVEQKGCHANGRIIVCGVKVKRSSAYSGIEAATGSAKERIPTNSCICSATRKALKRFAPFRCGEIRIAPVWRWADCVHLAQECDRE